MHKKLPLLVTALCLLGLSSLEAQAQPRPLRCTDFVRNPDGSWSPLVPITVNGVSMGPGVSFTPGVSFGGIDLAAILNAQCR